MSAKKPTMRDIAKAVGTSAVTVSKAMAGKPGMSDKLRSKILKKAGEMGYEDPRGNQLILREHLDIGILIPDKYFEAASFYAEIYKRLIKRLSDLGHFGLLEILSPESEKDLVLPKLEFQLMELLMNNPSVYFSADTLLDRVWGMAAEVEQGTVWTHISYLRSKLDALDAHAVIQSKRGFGYALEEKE